MDGPLVTQWDNPSTLLEGKVLLFPTRMDSAFITLNILHRFLVVEPDKTMNKNNLVDSLMFFFFQTDVFFLQHFPTILFFHLISAYEFSR